MLKPPSNPCTDPESFFQNGSKFELCFFIVFLVDEMIQIPIKEGQRNAIKMAFRWRANNDPALNAGLVCYFSEDPDQNC